MIHGDKAHFAVQWQLAPNPEGHYLLGHVCYWVGGKMIGEYAVETALSDVLACLTYPVGDCGNRKDEQFCGMNGPDLYALLQAGLFDSDRSLSSQVEQEAWARFDISMPIDVFDDWRLYLIDCESNSRLLVGRVATDVGYVFMCEEELRLGEFDAVIADFQAHLEQEQSRKGGL